MIATVVVIAIATPDQSPWHAMAPNPQMEGDALKRAPHLER